MQVNWQQAEEEARALDAADPLAGWRDEFAIPPHGDGDSVYLCGNSLGLMPRAAQREVQTVLRDWQHLGVHGHFEAKPDWYGYHEALLPQTAALTGSRPGEVAVMNSLTANLHLLMISFYRPQGKRRRIAIEAGAFPSDRYAVESQLRLHGLDPARDLILLEPRPGEDLLRTEDMEAVLEGEGENLALLLLGGVQYLTGQWFQVERLAAAAHKAGALVGLDLAHAIGNLPLALHDWEIDFAVWCNYKYLNGGPGAPGGCFVHERHGCGEDRPRLCGWWGNDPGSRFRMEDRFVAQPGAGAWQLSNPPILAMAALKGSLDLFHQVGMPALRKKSLALTGLLHRLLDGEDQPVEILSPADPEQRGCHLSLRLRGRARELVQELGRRGFVCDAREPDVLRVAPVPLYNRFTDVVAFARALRDAVQPGA
jgi:kynureninase